VPAPHFPYTKNKVLRPPYKRSHQCTFPQRYAPMALFPNLPDAARVWIHPARTPLSDETQTALLDRLGSFVDAWSSHQQAVRGGVTVLHDRFVVLAGAMLVLGAGTGTYKTVAVRLLSRTYPSQTGRVLGVYDTFGTFGGVAAPAAVVVAAALPAAFGAPWRTLFLASGFASLVLGAAILARVPDHLSSRSSPGGTAGGPPDDGREGAGESPPLRTYLALFREPRFTGFVAVTVLFGFAYNGTVAFLPLYLTSETVLSAAAANLLFSALFVVSLVQLVTGEASDRVGSLPVIVVALGVATAGLVAVVALSATGGPLVLGAAVVALGLGAHGYRPVRGAYLMAVIPDAVSGGSFGVVRTLLMGAGAVAPAVVGYLSETAGFRAAFGLLATSLGSALVLAVGLWILDR